jgi:hypothetical protein
MRLFLAYRRSVLWVETALFLCAPATAFAGMPFFNLSDTSRLRLETISFFLLILLIVAFVVQRLWNRLRVDFERLPVLSYRGALSFVLLWGLAFHLILAMISGARELMTPGAWQRDRATYKVRQIAPATESEQLQLARREKLGRLRTELWRHAEAHDGRFPTDDYSPDIPEGLWAVHDPSGLRYVYVAGSRVDEPETPLAFEPGIYGRERLVLFTTGEIKMLRQQEIYDSIPDDGL